MYQHVGIEIIIPPIKKINAWKTNEKCFCEHETNTNEFPQTLLVISYVKCLLEQLDAIDLMKGRGESEDRYVKMFAKTATKYIGK